MLAHREMLEHLEGQIKRLPHPLFNVNKVLDGEEGGNNLGASLNTFPGGYFMRRLVASQIIGFNYSHPPGPPPIIATFKCGGKADGIV